MKEMFLSKELAKMRGELEHQKKLVRVLAGELANKEHCRSMSLLSVENSHNHRDYQKMSISDEIGWAENEIRVAESKVKEQEAKP